MRDCVISVYSDSQERLAQAHLRLPLLPGQALLDRVYRDHIKKHKSAWAVVHEGTVPRALFVPETSLPPQVKRVAGKPKSRGRWITTKVELGSPYQRIYLGPEIFLRLVDLNGSHGWMTRALLGMEQLLESRPFPVGDATMWGWEGQEGRWFYTLERGEPQLWGAGNTAEDLLARVLGAEQPATARAFLWAIGAVRID
ncbi:MAG: hypothetical protein JXX28_06730 [Deltaproteobacteria bacterium]|nr:hypothetical protein [Deltaproteobacteria bacterium]